MFPATEYLTDAAQRTLLFWDVMRERGNQYREHMAETAPHVLEYAVELLIDGRTFPDPSTMRWSASSRLRASRSIRSSGRS